MKEKEGPFLPRDEHEAFEIMHEAADQKIPAPETSADQARLLEERKKRKKKTGPLPEPESPREQNWLGQWETKQEKDAEERREKEHGQPAGK